ncbi:hypothetical protein [Streptacidiphilus sp. EB103A]|uniref:hypothetical protein n=1 Tax=Streptacidiphilus sp. EB103A TaxID=3156275 RepID=UPI003511751F
MDDPGRGIAPQTADTGRGDPDTNHRPGNAPAPAHQALHHPPGNPDTDTAGSEQQQTTAGRRQHADTHHSSPAQDDPHNTTGRPGRPRPRPRPATVNRARDHGSEPGKP